MKPVGLNDVIGARQRVKVMEGGWDGGRVGGIYMQPGLNYLLPMTLIITAAIC